MTDFNYDLMAFICTAASFVITGGVGAYLLARMERNWKDKYEKLFFQKKSSEVRLGQISEQLAPFLKEFKYDPKQSHFIGQPIDYVIFEDDRVVFLEVKSGKSKLTKCQKDIKDNVEAGRVVFETMRIDGQEEAA